MMKAKPMQKVKTFLEKTPNALLCVLGAVVFLAAFYFLRSRTPLDKIWLPTTMNNDEALYNRQVVSVITHGGPQGYFGYQESTADIGRFSTWGPFLIWAYAIPGFLFGSSVNVVLWANILFIALGIAVFAHSAKLSWWQCIVLCAGLFAIAMPIRSCISGASEAMHYMLAFLIVGSAAALRRTDKTGWLAVCAAACAVETIFRPYALLFWVGMVFLGLLVPLMMYIGGGHSAASTIVAPVLVLCGDTPLLRGETLARLVEAARSCAGACAAMASSVRLMA